MKTIQLSLFAMIVMIILYALTAFGMMGPNPVGTTSTDTNPLIVPAGYAFSIWGIIYTGLIVFPIYHFIKRKALNNTWKTIHKWYAINVILNGLWLVGASYDWLWITVGIIILMLISLYQINEGFRSLKESEESWNYFTEQVVFSIYFAWITLATVLNVSSALHFYNWEGWGITQVNWTYIIMLVAAAIAGHIAWHKVDRAYAAVVVWAFVALALRHWGVTPMISYLAIGITVFFSGIIILKGAE